MELVNPPFKLFEIEIEDGEEVRASVLVQLPVLSLGC